LPHRKALPSHHRSYGLMRQTKILRLASLFAILNSLRRLLLAPAGNWPFPTLSPHSLHGCLDPYPVAFSQCTCPFLPGKLRPRRRTEQLGTPFSLCNATSTEGHFRDCIHSLMFKPPCLLGLQVAPTSVVIHRIARPFTPRISRLVTYPGLWYRCMPELGN
jgi:hypothetical protein